MYSALALGAVTFLVLWPLSLVLARRLGRQLHHPGRLPDLGHRCLPDLSRWMWLGNCVALASLLWTLIIADDRIHYLQYICGLQLIRMACFLATTLPDASQRAHLKTGLASYFLGGMHDLLPSGHVLLEYGSLLWTYRRGLIYDDEWWRYLGVVVLGSTISVGSRSHYTVDVLLAPAVCHWMWDMLH